MEMKNIIKNQERVIEQLMFDMLNIKIDIEEVDEVAWVDRTKLNYFYILYLYYYYITIIIIYYLLFIILESKKKVEKDKVETMGGVGGHPPKYSIIKVK